MTIVNVLRSREWVITRRLILVGIVLFLAVRSYGDYFLGWLQRPDAARDIAILRSEFRPDLPGEKPAWIIEFENTSTRFTYEQIRLEATYLDSAGMTIEKDTLLVNQKLAPGEEKLIGSVDFRERPQAANGTLKVLDAAVVE